MVSFTMACQAALQISNEAHGLLAEEDSLDCTGSIRLISILPVMVCASQQDFLSKLGPLY